MPPDRRVALVLLAAGRSTRFGADKLRAKLGDRTVLDHAIAAAEGASVAARFLVRPPGLSEDPAPPGWTRVATATEQDGISGSIRAGVAAARDHSNVLITLGDMPFLTPGFLSGLAARVRPTFTRQTDGSTGCPAIFPAASFDALLSLKGDRGASARSWPDADIIAPDDPGMLQDVDYPSDLPTTLSD